MSTDCFSIFWLHLHCWNVQLQNSSLLRILVETFCSFWNDFGHMSWYFLIDCQILTKFLEHSGRKVWCDQTAALRTKPYVGICLCSPPPIAYRCFPGQDGWFLCCTVCPQVNFLKKYSILKQQWIYWDCHWRPPSGHQHRAGCQKFIASQEEIKKEAEKGAACIGDTSIVVNFPCLQ